MVPMVTRASKLEISGTPSIGEGGRTSSIFVLISKLILDFEIGAHPLFKSDGIYLHLLLNKPDKIAVNFCGNVPGQISGALLRFIIETMSRLVLAQLKLLIALFVVKIASYPSTFPGTFIPWRPNMNTTPSNDGPYLTFSGDPTFK